MTNNLKKLFLNWTEYTIPDTTYESKTAASEGTDLSLVTTGEKYNWNWKQDALSAWTWISISNNTVSIWSSVLVNRSNATNWVSVVWEATSVQWTNVWAVSYAASMSTALWFSARSSSIQSIAIWHWAAVGTSSTHSISIWEQSQANSPYAIQLWRWTNTEAWSLYIWTSTNPTSSSPTLVNYKLLDKDGKIPNDRLDLSGKQDTLVSWTNIKTINNNSLLGSGDLETEKVIMKTQTEYDNLPSSKESDWNTYFIYTTS